MDAKNKTIAILQELAQSPDEMLYHDMIGLIQYEASQKGIEFDGFFRRLWEIEAEHPFFNEEYFENERRRQLYVYQAALIDEEVFFWVQYAWNITHEEVLCENILHREIYNLKEQGVKF